jgi:excisionase family DNA binding protein
MTDSKVQTKELFTVPEAAKLIGCGGTKTRELIASGKLGHYRIGKKILVGGHHIEDFKRRSEVPPIDPQASKTVAGRVVAAARQKARVMS